MKNILLLDSEGKRVAVKYFSDDWPTNGAKLAFEKSIFTKTLKTNARIEGMQNKCDCRTYRVCPVKKSSSICYRKLYVISPELQCS